MEVMYDTFDLLTPVITTRKQSVRKRNGREVLKVDPKGRK